MTDKTVILNDKQIRMIVDALIFYRSYVYVMTEDKDMAADIIETLDPEYFYYRTWT